MANEQAQLEKLVVVIEANYNKLLDSARKGVALTEEELKGLEKTTKKTFSESEKAAKKAAAEAVKATREQIREHKMVLKLTKELDKELAGVPKKYEAISSSAQGVTGKVKSFGLAAAAAITVVFAAVVAGIRGAMVLAEEAIGGLRTERAFRQLSANANQSADEILAAMRRASGGTVKDVTLMTSAVDALNAEVAETPEQFERLTQAAIKLGRAKGISPEEALGRLTGGIARREIELLDELGIRLPEVNAEMDKLAQRDFGKPASGLSAIERESLFAEAALNVAAEAANALGGSIEDIGSQVEQTQAKLDNFKQDAGEAFLVIETKAIQAAEGMFNAFLAKSGLFPSIAEGGLILQNTAAAIMASFVSAAGVIAQTGKQVINVLRGEAVTLKDPFTQFAENFQTSFKTIKASFPEVFDPQSMVTPIKPSGGATGDTEAADKAQKFLLDSFGELADLKEELDEQAEQEAVAHGEAMVKIETEFAEKRIEAAQELTKDLAKLEEETTEERERIISEAKEELAELERETDQQLEQERDQFNTTERRETEDHLREMRRLRLDYLTNLGQAVAARDTRAIVDLQANFRRERTERQQDFEIKRSRDGEDQSLRLNQIRQQEEERAAEIVRNREKELTDLAAAEEKKRAELQASFQEQIVQLTTAEEEKKAAEIASYEARQAELEAAMGKRLEALAEKLAEEDSINATGAKRILETLAETFGEGGKIDELMSAFRERMKARIDIQTSFENSSLPGIGSSEGSHQGSGNQVVPMRAFARGGSILATRPTVALFGESGPEIGNFLPLNQMQQGGNREIEMTLDLRLSGTAPPGIQSADRDAIANTLVQAFQEAGIRVKPGR